MPGQGATEKKGRTGEDQGRAEAGHRDLEKKELGEERREKEAAKEFEVQLKEGVKAMDLLRKCSISEIGEILVVTPERIEGCGVVASGAIEVMCKTEKGRNEAVQEARTNK